jgi:hypothetical protein
VVWEDGEVLTLTSYPILARMRTRNCFGEVIERQLPAPNYIVEKQFLLNLDNGEWLSMPIHVWMAGVSLKLRYKLVRRLTPIK